MPLPSLQPRSIFWLLGVLCLTLGRVDGKSVEDWIRQLSAANFEKREAASAALWNIGAPALDALEIATKSSDPEVKLRAEALTRKVRLGITPEWPESLAEQAMLSGRMDKGELRFFLQTLPEELGLEAVPFLLHCLGGKASTDAESLLETMIENVEGTTDRILTGIQHPTHPRQTAMLASALRQSGHLDHLARAVALPLLSDEDRNAIERDVITQLKEQGEAEDYKTLKQRAAKFAALDPHSASYLYLQAIATALLGEEEEALALRLRALDLNPDDEVAHYNAATLLQELGQHNVAASEWEKILTIKPVDSVYDMNAMIRLSGIHETRGNFKKAAEYLERNLEIYRNRQGDGEGIFMLGAEVEQIEDMIATLRKKAQFQQEIQDSPATVNVEAILPPQELKHYQDARKDAFVTMTMNVEPYGLRLLEKGVTDVVYSPEKRQLEILLNRQSFGQQVDMDAPPETFRALIRSLDRRYVYEINSQTGEAKKLRTFDVAYRVTFTLPEEIRSLKDATLTVNETPMTFKELDSGVDYDFLPKEIQFEFKGTSPNEDPIRGSFLLDPRELEPDLP